MTLYSVAKWVEHRRITASYISKKTKIFSRIYSKSIYFKPIKAMDTDKHDQHNPLIQLLNTI